jgi:Gylcosyl hydrolase family 115 C-terminal domain
MGSAPRIELYIVSLVFLACPLRGLAIGQPQYIGTTATPDGFTLARAGTTAKLYVDPMDDPGVIHAARELRADIQHVTGAPTPPVIVDALAGDSPHAWATAVSDGVRKVITTLHVATPGYHTLKFRMIDPGVVLEKLIVGFADPDAHRLPGAAAPMEPAIPPSCLGPPESYYRITSAARLATAR